MYFFGSWSLWTVLLTTMFLSDQKVKVREVLNDFQITVRKKASSKIISGIFLNVIFDIVDGTLKMIFHASASAVFQH